METVRNVEFRQDSSQKRAMSVLKITNALKFRGRHDGTMGGARACAKGNAIKTPEHTGQHETSRPVNLARRSRHD
jgi:hypothetical protein